MSWLSTISNTSKTPVSAFYRKVLKSIPKVMVVYDLDMSEKDVREAVKNLFRKNGHVTDPRVVDRLLHKGEMDFEETIKQWKQKNHVHDLLGHSR